MSKLKEVFDLIAKYSAKLSENEPEKEAKMSVEEMTSGTLADGTLIYTDAAEWGVGVKVFREENGEPQLVEEDDLTLENGQVIVVRRGVIESVTSSDRAAEKPQDEGATDGKDGGKDGGNDAPPDRGGETRMSKQEQEELIDAIGKVIDARLSAVEAKIEALTVKQSQEIEKIKLASTSKPARNASAKKNDVNIKDLPSQEVPFAIIEKYKNQ